MAPLRHALVGLAVAMGVAVPAAAAPAPAPPAATAPAATAPVATAPVATAPAPAPAPAADRPMGHVFDWSTELNEEELPEWNLKTAPPVPAAKWYRTIDSILATAGP